MASRTIRAEESLGLLWAVALHCALGLALVLFRPGAMLPPKESVMTVTLSDEIGPEATSPDPTPEFKPDTAPMLGEVPPPPAPEPIAEPVAKPSPQPRPVARPVASPTARPTTRPTARPSQPPNPRATQSPRPNQSGRPGGRRVGDDFLEGVDGPATPSAQQLSTFQSSINRLVLPHWNRCAVSGLEVERLRAVVRFSLTREGSIQSIAEPQITGITDSNRPQVARFSECAVRAVRLGAPYRLPPEFYEHWRERRLTFSKRD